MNDDSDLNLNIMPFEGYDLEELWNWMDSGGAIESFEDTSWANGTGGRDT